VEARVDGLREGIEHGVKAIVNMCDDHAAAYPMISNAARGEIGELRRISARARGLHYRRLLEDELWYHRVHPRR
jgi:hypothetical protein